MNQTESANVSKSQLRPGLTLVATPIGNARDMTLRALDALRDADVIACEDTRVGRRLMDLHGVSLNGRPILSYHEHNATEVLPRLLGVMENGGRLVYLTDAGTPLIADPGFKLAQAAIAEGFTLSATPGPCAAVMALTLSNLPSDRFTFVGFPPPKSGQRQRVFQELAGMRSTLIFYESPRRLAASLADMAIAFGDRDAAVARELTKAFEQVRRGPLSTLAAHYAEAGPPKGEVVVLLGPPKEPDQPPEELLDEALLTAMQAMSVRDAARAVADALNIPRKAAYARALELKEAQS